MRNSYYDYNGWGRDSGVVPKKWEPGERPAPYGAVPGEPPEAPQAPSGPKTGTPGVRRPPRKKKKSGFGGFVLFLTFMILLTEVGVYFQGGVEALPGRLDGLWDQELPWEGWEIDPWEDYEDDWVEDLKDTTTTRAPTGDGTTLTLLPEEGETLTPREIYERVSPAIIGIRATLKDGTALGSGIIMSSDGYIITNAHVIAGSRRVEAVLTDGAKKTALLVGYDRESDLAVLKIKAQDLPVAQFGDSSALGVGDPAYAIGNPLGEELWGTMTDGIISATDRKVYMDGWDMTLLQTNAAINSGNSGGALIDQYGRVVGITNMKMMSEWETIEGLGFAVPTASAKVVVDEIIARGYYEGPPVLGVTVRTQEAEGETPAGAYVASVNRFSSAYEQGVREGDVIIEANGRSVTCVEDLEQAKEGLEVGGTMRLKLWTELGTRYVNVALTSRHQLETLSPP